MTNPLVQAPRHKNIVKSFNNGHTVVHQAMLDSALLYHYSASQISEFCEPDKHFLVYFQFQGYKCIEGQCTHKGKLMGDPGAGAPDIGWAFGPTLLWALCTLLLLLPPAQQPAVPFTLPPCSLSSLSTPSLPNSIWIKNVSLTG